MRTYKCTDSAPGQSATRTKGCTFIFPVKGYDDGEPVVAPPCWAFVENVVDARPKI